MPEADFLFPGFERVVDDRTITGPVRHAPEPAHERPGAMREVRERRTGVRPRFVNTAQVPLEKYASILSPLEYGTLFLVGLDVVFPEPLQAHAEALGQFLRIPLGDF